MKQNETKKMPKKTEDFSCEVCNFICSKKSNYNAHLTTRKHISALNETKLKQPNIFCIQSICPVCNDEFNSRSTLCRHRKKCQKNAVLYTHTIDAVNESAQSTIVDVIKQNADFKELIIEQNKLLREQSKSIMELVSKNTGNTTITCNNTTNQKFNLNFFLNTTCKDAMNLSEFIENINIDLKEIENIGTDGYVSGMTNLILSRIRDLDITKRPIHCTDLKREIMYIKDNDEWCKDTPENNKLRNMITIVAKQNYSSLPLWREQHPECNNYDHPRYNLCIDMMRNILGDVGTDQIKLDNKVIKNIAKHISIDK
jgi:hypothetical protein